MIRDPTITAHRGSSGSAPENTLAAFRHAIVDGADGAELDVLQAKDGALVVTHDVNLSRVAGVDVNVYDLTREDLPGLAAGAHFGGAFADEPIPTLEQVIESTRDRLRLNIELKTHGHEKGFARGVVETIQGQRIVEACVVTSRNTDLLGEVRRLAPELVLGVVLEEAADAAGDHDVELYSVHHVMTTATFVREAHARGRSVHVWTVDAPADIARFASYGVDDVITNVPRLARHVLDEYTAA